MGKDSLLPAFIDMGSDFSSMPRSTLKEPIKWVKEMSIQTYNMKISNQPVALVQVKFCEWEGELPVLVHSNGDGKFLIRGDLLYRQTHYKGSTGGGAGSTENCHSKG